jgi:hypothetical protein
VTEGPARLYGNSARPDKPNPHLAALRHATSAHGLPARSRSRERQCGPNDHRDHRGIGSNPMPCLSPIAPMLTPPQIRRSRSGARRTGGLLPGQPKAPMRVPGSWVLGLATASLQIAGGPAPALPSSPEGRCGGVWRGRRGLPPAALHRRDPLNLRLGHRTNPRISPMTSHQPSNPQGGLHRTRTDTRGRMHKDHVGRYRCPTYD